MTPTADFQSLNRHDDVVSAKRAVKSFVKLIMVTLMVFVALLVLSVSKSTSAFIARSPNVLTRHQAYSTTTTVLFGRRRGQGKVEKKPSKSNLPEKICVVCGRPFSYRKKWERCWDEVTCCSKSCNSKRRAGAGGSDTEAYSN